jgi:catechol 2,3-dioxygenase-like lactoylglutathione lyase family enzyme
MEPRIGHIEVFVQDPVASRDWYVSVLGAKLVADQGQAQWVALGVVEVLLRPGKGSTASAYRATSVAPVLYLSDLDAFHERLESFGVVVSHGDEDECLTFQDPDGHWYQATTHP